MFRLHADVPPLDARDLGYFECMHCAHGHARCEAVICDTVGATGRRDMPMYVLNTSPIHSNA